MLQPLFKVNGLWAAYSTAQEGFSLDEIVENSAYILDASGWKQFKRNGVSTSLISIPKVDGLPEFKEEIKLSSSKIPWDLIKQVTAFFTAVYKKQKSEAVGYLYYQANTGEWEFIPPVQTATGASASYGEPPKKDGWMVAGTIHSHGSMSAFHSGTDHKDEQHFDGIHITIGKVDGSNPEYAYSIMSQGGRLKVDDPSDLVDKMDPSEEVPASWLEAIKLSEPDIIDDDKVGKTAEKLYKRYLTGKLSEEEYLKALKPLEEKAETPIIDATHHAGYQPYGFLDVRRYGGRSHRWGEY